MSTVKFTPFARSRSARAALWLMRLRDNTLTARARQQFRRWFHADPANRQSVRKGRRDI